MKLKKLLSTALCAVLGTVIVFSGCSGSGSENSEAESSPVSSVAESKTESKTESKAESKTESKTESKSESKEASKSESSKSTEPDADYTPAMWNVTKGGKEMYLFGSIHATKDGAENLPSYVQQAFDECDYLAVELNMDDITNNLEQSLKLAKKIMYTDGTTIKDHISKETYDSAVKLLTKHGMYTSYYDNFKPMMWISLIENVIYKEAGIDVNSSMETIMSNKAKKAGKEILEVENIDIQVGVFDNISDKLADALISSYTEENAVKEAADSNNALYESWKHGEVIGDTDSEEIPEEYKADYEAYNKAILTDRNVGMADKAEQYMNDGKKVFFMVGTAHMYGDDGIVSLLKQRGYTVERVSPTAESSKLAA